MRSKKMIKTDKVIYRTRTLEEYDWLMEKLEEAGLMWANGSLPTAPEEADNWEEYLLRTGICLDYKMISYGDFNYYKTESEYKDYEFIEVSELMKEETEAQDKTEKETDALEELEAIHKQVTSQIEGLRKQGKEPKAIEYTIKVCFE